MSSFLDNKESEEADFSFQQAINTPPTAAEVSPKFDNPFKKVDEKNTPGNGRTGGGNHRHSLLKNG